MKYDVVIVAGGKGKRAKLGYNKAFFVMENNKTVIENCADIFINDKDCAQVIVVINETLPFTNEKVICVNGGKERRDSVQNGLDLVTADYVLIHDGARPYLNKKALNKVKKEVINKKAVVLGKKATDTIKVVKNNRIEKTLDRNTIYLAETPQAFKTSLIKKCYKNCADINFTDDGSLVESLGYKVYIVEDEFDNKKLTRPEDFKR